MKAGVIGLGFMGAAHVAAIITHREAQLAAVVSRDARTRAGDFSQTGGNLQLEKTQFDFSGVRKYSAWTEIVKDEDIDVISICLPTHFHSEVAIAALSEGKHVLCEKPMALTLPECERMMRAAEDAKRCLMIGQVLRFWPEYKALRQFVTQGQHGRLRQATFSRHCGLPDWSKWLPDETKSGGAILDLLIHDIDQILLLFGMPERVTAKQVSERDALMASFIYPGGPEVRLQGGWLMPGAAFSMSFQVRADAGEVELTRDGLMLSDMSGIRRRMAVEPANAYEAEMHYFLDCCGSGAEPLFCPPVESLNAVRVALALKESRANEGKQIRC